jgi:hypothetical protein
MDQDLIDAVIFFVGAWVLLSWVGISWWGMFHNTIDRKPSRLLLFYGVSILTINPDKFTETGKAWRKSFIISLFSSAICFALFCMYQILWR